jgi:hypothetical protein
MEFDKTLMKIIVEIYNEKIVGLTSKSDSACEELLVCEEAPPSEEARLGDDT